MSLELAHRIQTEIPQKVHDLQGCFDVTDVSLLSCIRLVAQTDMPDVTARSFIASIAQKSKVSTGDCMVLFYREWLAHFDSSCLEPENKFLPNSEHVIRFLADTSWCERGPRKTHFVRFAALWKGYCDYAQRHSTPALGRSTFYRVVLSKPIRQVLDIGGGAETGTGCAVFRGVRLTEL